MDKIIYSIQRIITFNVKALALLSIFLLNSCAALLNEPTQYIELYTAPESKVIIKDDTLKTRNGKMVLTVERGKQPLQFIVQNDSASKTVSIPSKSSFAYWLNAYPAPMLGLGLWFERDKPERYTYPKRVRVNLSDTTEPYLSLKPQSSANSIHLHLSMPYVNSFLLRPDGETDSKINTGFLGLSGGLDFYYTPKKFIHLSVSGAIDAFTPIPAAVDVDGEYEVMASLFFSASHNHRFNKFLLGSGLSLSRNLWRFTYNAFSEETPPPSRDPVRRINDAMGFVFPAYYRVSDHFYVGAIYRPTLLRLSARNRFDYEHLISLDLAWKIGLR